MAPIKISTNELLEAVQSLGVMGGHPGPGWYRTSELAEAAHVSPETMRKQLAEAERKGTWERVVRSGRTGSRLTYWRKTNGKKP